MVPELKKLIIIGAGGLGREVAWLVERINHQSPTWNLLGFVDDNPNLHHTIVNGHPVLGGCEMLAAYPDVYAVCAVGAPKVRRKIIEKIKTISPSRKFATLLDPTVEKSDTVTIGEGSIVCAHSILTVNIHVGDHVIVNLDCKIGHDAVVDGFATVHPSVNISGDVHVGEGAELGTGTRIIQRTTIGRNAVVGIGSVVVNDILGDCVAVGCPARVVKFNS